MVVIKTSLKMLPENCADCIWFSCQPHPYKGWIDVCELAAHCVDDDQDEAWIYSGDGRPKNCPLMEVGDAHDPD